MAEKQKNYLVDSLEDPFEYFEPYIQSTENYSRFKKALYNREIREATVLRYVESIRSLNMLKFNPILVDNGFNVLDGQHRLEAASRLQLQIYFIVLEDVNPGSKLAHDIVAALNINQKPWEFRDFLHKHIATENPDYVLLESLMRQNGLKISSVLAIVDWNKTGGHRYDNKTAGKFQNGTFQFYPTGRDKEDVQDRINWTLKCYHFLNEKRISTADLETSFVVTTTFLRALSGFLDRPDVSRSQFFTKLQSCSHLLVACAGISLYRKLFVTLYNWKNRNRIPEKAPTEIEQMEKSD